MHLSIPHWPFAEYRAREGCHFFARLVKYLNCQRGLPKVQHQVYTLLCEGKYEGSKRWWCCIYFDVTHKWKMQKQEYEKGQKLEMVMMLIWRASWLRNWFLPVKIFQALSFCKVPRVHIVCKIELNVRKFFENTGTFTEVCVIKQVE